MYKTIKIEDVVRVPPHRFGEPLKEVIEDILRHGYEYKGGVVGGYEGLLDRDLGVILAVTDVESIEEGRIIPNDGASYHKTVFNAIVFKPELHEVLDCEVVDVVEFGAFVRFGPIDGLVHVSQIADDYISYDEKRAALIGKTTNKVLEVGDRVRARIVAMSASPEGQREGKINLTMRQANLGKFEWIAEEKKKKEEKAPKEKKGEKKEKEVKDEA
ncbi:MAG: DNA-directed RNA polymerase [Methanobacteriota archaeon]|nr:MAG: DNA-directed RNA polymerase [Euryarchaeota archaeon]